MEVKGGKSREDIIWKGEVKHVQDAEAANTWVEAGYLGSPVPFLNRTRHTFIEEKTEAQASPSKCKEKKSRSPAVQFHIPLTMCQRN